MLQEYTDHLNWAKSNRKQIKRFYQKNSSKKDIDQRFRLADKEAFECVDCLQCANCCKTVGPLFTQKDIQRISQTLKLSEAEFTQKYLRKDDDGDWILNSVPCPFLLDDNRCSIYENRPRACASYPHTTEKGQASLAELTTKNSRHCPAVAHMFKNLLS